MARAADKMGNFRYRLENFQDDDFVFRNGEALQELVKDDLEFLSQDCLDATECLLRLVTYYRAEILKLHRQSMKAPASGLATRDPILAQKGPNDGAPFSGQAR